MSAVDPQAEQERREIQKEYLDFLDDEPDQGFYTDKIRQMINDQSSRLVVNLDDIRAKYPKRLQGLFNNSVTELICLQNSLKEITSRIDPDYIKVKEDFFVGFEGSFGQRHVTPRTLKSQMLGTLVCCEGIVTKCSLIRPKIVKSVHYCPATNKMIERKYADLTSYDSTPTGSAYPTEDENKNPLETEFGLSTYKNHQTFSIQELPENAPPGQLPRSTDIINDDDLADRCKPGDRVRVIGLYRCLPSKQQGFTNGTFRTVIIANNIQLLSKETSEAELEGRDYQQARKIGRQKNIVDTLARSLAPSIFGHEEVKKAILCMLLGGTEKILPNGTRLRGDVNVLLIGDPSVAKSQLLRYVLYTAPRAIPTTGRGSSGVGLTAAVTTDQETGERRLEAGAMVLGDRGIVCIDEFDKMSDIDRTAIHEVMEQGRVTIAKAGIHAKLNARCSVLAAANPVYGKYDIYKNPMENIGMQDSLLSRFDLLFVLLDEHHAERDKSISEHVVNLHKYRAPGEVDGAVLEMGNALETLTTFDLDETADDGEIHEKNKSWIGLKSSEKIFNMRFMRKYIQVARTIKPKLSQEAADFISEKYAELRTFDEKQSDRERTMPVTARTLETLIRLSTAFARARFSKSIDKQDSEKAHSLLHFACFKEKPKERLEEERRKRRRQEGDDYDEEEDEETAMTQEEQDEVQSEPSASGRQTRSSKRTDQSTGEEEGALSPATKKSRQEEKPAISVDRYEAFKRHLRSVVPSADQVMDVEEAVAQIQEKAGKSKFREGEVTAALERLSDDNIAMVSEGTLMLI